MTKHIWSNYVSIFMLCFVLLYRQCQFKRSFLYFSLWNKGVKNCHELNNRIFLLIFFCPTQNYTKSLLCSFLISKERSVLSRLLYCTMLQLHIYHNPRKVITFLKLLQKKQQPKKSQDSQQDEICITENTSS